MANVVDDRSKGNSGKVSNLLMSLNDDGDKNLVEGAVATGKCTPSYLPAHISTYADLKAGQVYQQVTARSLASELGVEDHRKKYHVGNVVTCHVIKLQKKMLSKGKIQQEEGEIDEMDNKDIDAMKKNLVLFYFEIC